MSSNIRVKRICQYCRKEFEAKQVSTKFCSKICNSRDYKKAIKEMKIECSDKETTSIKNKPILDIKAKEFLTVKDAAILINCSIRTTYDLIKRGTLIAVNLSTRKTLIKRSEIDRLFELPVSVPPVKESIPEKVYYDESELYVVKLKWTFC